MRAVQFTWSRRGGVNEERMEQRTTKRHRSSDSLPVLAASVLVLIASHGLSSSIGLAGEFHFVVHDVEEGAAAWTPREVVIHKSTDLEGGLVFVLENPTPRTHVFEAPGLFEELLGEGSDVRTVEPLRVYVAPGETVRVQVSTEQLNREPERDAAGSQNCQVFCPLHGNEDSLRSQIRVVP